MGREFRIAVTCDSQELRLDVVGDVDPLRGRHLLDTICAAADLGCRVVAVHLGCAGSVDPSAIGALAVAERRLRTTGIRLRIHGAPPERVPDLVGLGLQGCLCRCGTGHGDERRSAACRAPRPTGATSGCPAVRAT